MLIEQVENQKDIPLKEWLKSLDFGDISKKLVVNAEVMLIKSRNRIMIEIELKDNY